jgi:hypothetical protein
MTISLETPGRRWIPFRRRLFSIALPQAWEHIPDRRRRKYWKMLVVQGAEATREKALKDIIPAFAFQALNIADRAALHIALEWMQLSASPMPAIDHFTHRLRTYYLPKANFENGSCGEFALADGYYQEFIESRTEEALLNLVATLCRPAKKRRRNILSTGDIRIPMIRKEEVEARGRRLKGLPPHISMAVLLYFAGIKEFVASTYWMIFRPPSPAETPEVPERGPLFGWWSKMMQVAETGLFGTYDEVAQKRLHLICMYLVDQNEIYERQKAQMEMDTANHKMKFSNDTIGD